MSFSNCSKDATTYIFLLDDNCLKEVASHLPSCMIVILSSVCKRFRDLFKNRSVIDRKDLIEGIIRNGYLDLIKKVNRKYIPSNAIDLTAREGHLEALKW